jgi:FlaA1/EpsC-like NDP-sugar epimerase
MVLVEPGGIDDVMDTDPSVAIHVYTCTIDHNQKEITMLRTVFYLISSLPVILVTVTILSGIALKVLNAYGYSFDFRRMLIAASFVMAFVFLLTILFRKSIDVSSSSFYYISFIIFSLVVVVGLSWRMKRKISSC